MAPTTRNRGADFVRSGIALALAGGNREQAIRVAETRWGGDAMAARIVGRAAVPAAAVGGVWAGQLAEAAGEGREFYSSVSEASVFLRLPGVRRLPAGVKAVATVSGTSAEWRGQGTAYPVSSAVFDVRAINLLDLGVLAVVTKELLESGDALAEGVIRNDLVLAVANAIDAKAFSTAAAVSGVSPAGLLNGVSSSGTDIADLAEAIADFPGDLSKAVFVLHPATAAAIAGFDHRDLGIAGGELLGAPAFTSRHVARGKLAVIDPAGLALVEGETSIETSQSAAIQMESAPTNTSIGSNPTETTLVSMFQTNSRALLVTQASQLGSRPRRRSRCPRHHHGELIMGKSRKVRAKARAAGDGDEAATAGRRWQNLYVAKHYQGKFPGLGKPT